MRKLLVILIVCFTAPVLAQKNQDFWQWTTISLEKSLGQKFTLKLDEEIRLYDNASRLNLTYTNLGLAYKIAGPFRTAFTYRFIQKKEDDGSFSLRHRLMLDLIFKYKIKPVGFTYRSRIQGQVRDVNSSPDGGVPEKYWRNKFDFKFDFDKPYGPYVSAEFRYQFRNNRLIESNNNWGRARYYIGCDYKINDGNELGVYYMIQKNFNVIDPETDYTLGISYTLDLDFLFNKAKEKEILEPGTTK